MYYIHKISSISHQNSFDDPLFFYTKNILNEQSELIVPNYKDLLNPTSLRRLSPILRMSIVNALSCQNENEFDGIIVGTALGCLLDTEKFLHTIVTSESDVISPTSFIQSTHNTIGGQISLYLKNHAYNMTFTQNAISFEVSLIDAISVLNEDQTNVLVGASDEKIDFLEKLRPELISTPNCLTSISTFLNLQKSNLENRLIFVKDVKIFNHSKQNINNLIASFLDINKISKRDLTLILHSNIENFEHNKSINYLDYTGLNYSASALALHLGHSFLQKEETGYVLICNNLCENHLGLTLIGK